MKLIPAVLSAMTFASVGYAQQSEICSTHTVMRGESLRIIAEKYLGTREQSPVIYSANRSVVGGDPNLITVGMVLQIPCASGQTATAVVASAAPAAAEPAIIEAAPAAEAASATRSIAADGFGGGIVAVVAESPFVDASMPNGGAMSAVMTTALGRAGAGMPAVALSTSGTAGTLEAMGRDARLEVGFPVIRPNCFSSNLSAVSSGLCNNFYFSSPMFEVVTTLFARKSDNLQITSAETMAGLNVCIPDFYPFEDLQDLGMALTESTMVEPGSVQACFDALFAGEVDLVYADFLTAEHTIGNIDMRGDIEPLSRFAWIKTVHAVSHNGNANGVNLLTKLNEGFANMVASGEWRAMMRELLSS